MLLHGRQLKNATSWERIEDGGVPVIHLGLSLLLGLGLGLGLGIFLVVLGISNCQRMWGDLQVTIYIFLVLARQPSIDLGGVRKKTSLEQVRWDWDNEIVFSRTALWKYIHHLIMPFRAWTPSPTIQGQRRKTRP